MSSLPRFIHCIFFTVLLLFAGNVLAQTATAPSGSGIPADPYQIATLNNLYWITQNSSCWGSYFVQTADIDASGSSSWASDTGFTPIGNSTKHFTGSYDGQGYKITGVYINRPSTNYVGLFGYVGAATIKNVKIESANVTGSQWIGALIGGQYGATVTDCSSSGSVNGYCVVGGLIGCEEPSGSTTTNCHSSASATGTSSFSQEIGGLIGEQYGCGATQCYSTGSVTGGSYVGGLIGEQYEYATATNCYSTGSVTGSGSWVGGLIGWLYSNNSVTKCYSCGSVSGGSTLGGLIGFQANSPNTVSSCFWDNQTSGRSSSAGGIGESTTNMKTQSTFSGWDFTTVWAISSGVNNGYPYLLGVTDLPLAVEATDFLATADLGSVTLSWQTQSEVNNAGFNILREDPSTTSGSTSLTTGFKVISSYTSNNNLKGLGTSTSGRAYDFTDNKVTSGKTYQYKIQSVSTNGTTSDLTTLSVTVDVPKNYALYQNYPNPFNPSTTIRFDLKQKSTVSLEIYNVLGQRVEYWNYGMMDAGRYNEVVNMDRFASGVYYYRINAVGNDGEKFASIKKLMLVK